MNPGNSEFTQAFFEESSRGWMANKVKKADCTYVYKCVGSESCKKPVTAFETMTCRTHSVSEKPVKDVKEVKQEKPVKKVKQEKQVTSTIVTRATLVGTRYMTRAKTRTLGLR